ncbi:hypothetical protein F4679DRAFT_128665 [Xylaria curta]|nr:hypothetical protein F4679DRAFT_128665 [Xylaria curta]
MNQLPSQLGIEQPGFEAEYTQDERLPRMQRLNSEVLPLVPLQNPNLNDLLYTSIENNPFAHVQLGEHVQIQGRNNDSLLRIPDSPNWYTFGSSDTMLSSNSSSVFPCEKCSSEFKYKKDLRRHFATKHRDVEDVHYCCRCGSKNPRRDNHLRHIQRCNKETRHPFICKCGYQDDSKKQYDSHVRTCRWPRSNIRTPQGLQTGWCGPSAQGAIVATIGQVDYSIERETSSLSPDSLAAGQPLDLLENGKQEKGDEYSLDSDLLSLSDLTDEQEDIRNKVDSSTQEKALNLLLQKYFASKEDTSATCESVSSKGVQAKNNKYPEASRPVGPSRYPVCQDVTESTGKGKSSSPLAMSASSSSTSSEGSKRKTTDENTTEKKQKSAAPKCRAKKVKTDNCQRVLACPYWKLNSKEHRNCGTLKITAIKYVKQHLIRSHTPKYYCQRCFMVFKDSQSFEAHLSSEPVCPRAPKGHAIGIITPEKREDLSRRSNPNLSEEEQWFVIWDILFEGQTRPSSAYVDLTLSEELRSFREFWSKEGPEILMKELDSGNVWSSAEQREVQGRSLLQRGQEEIYNRWIANRQISDLATSGQPSSSSSGSVAAQQTTTTRNSLTIPHSSTSASSLIETLNETNTSIVSNEFGGQNIASGEETIVQALGHVSEGWGDHHVEQPHVPQDNRMLLGSDDFRGNNGTNAGIPEFDYDAWLASDQFSGDSSPSALGNDCNEIDHEDNQSKSYRKRSDDESGGNSPSHFDRFGNST